MEPMGKPKISSGMGLAISVASISTASILIRLSSAEPLVLAAYRLTISTIVLLPVTGYVGLGNLRQISRRDFLVLIIVGSSLALHFALWITSLSYTTVAASVLMVTTSPIFVALIGRAFLGERVTSRSALGIAMAMAGVALVVLPGGELSGELGGILLALGGAIAVSLYLIGGRKLRQNLPLITYVFWVYAIASILLLAASLALGVKLTGFPARDYTIFLLLGIIPSHLGHTLFNYLLRFLDAKIIAVSTLGEPILSSLLALAILSEMPSPSIFLGAPFVLLGIYVTAAGSRSST